MLICHKTTKNVRVAGTKSISSADNVNIAIGGPKFITVLICHKTTKIYGLQAPTVFPVLIMLTLRSVARNLLVLICHKTTKMYGLQAPTVFPVLIMLILRSVTEKRIKV